MLTWILTGIFIVVMIGIGVWGMRKTQTLGDFFLGGRTLGPWVSAFAYGTSYYSAVMFIGFAGKLGWGLGLNVLWISLGNTLCGCLLAWLILGYRTRWMTHNLDVMTMPEFFDERFQAPGLKIFSAIIIFIFMLPYSASVFQGLGYLFEISLGLDYTTALLAMSVITGVYLVLGGYFAITLNDFIQGLVMVGGSLAMIYILVNSAGGLTSAVYQINQNYHVHVPEAPSWWMIGSLVFMTSFGVWGLPQMVQKFYAIKEERQIIPAMLVTTIFSLIVVFSAYFVGAMTHIFYGIPNSPAQFSFQNGINQDLKIGNVPTLIKDGQPVLKEGIPVMDYDKFVPDLLKNKLPEALMAIIVVLVLSASMSTLSSVILVASSAVAIDLYKGHANLGESTEKPLVMIRFLSGLFILISFFVALSKFDVIVTLMSLSWGAVAGAFMAPFLYGLYWKGTTRLGVTAGMITGLTVNTVLFFWWGPNFAPAAATLAMVVPFFVIPAVSFVTTPPDREVINRAFQKTRIIIPETRDL